MAHRVPFTRDHPLGIGRHSGEGVVVQLAGEERVDVLERLAGRRGDQKHLGVPGARTLVGIENVAMGRIRVPDVGPTLSAQVGWYRLDPSVELVGAMPRSGDGRDTFAGAKRVLVIAPDGGPAGDAGLGGRAD